MKTTFQLSKRGRAVAIVGEVDEALAWAVVHLAGQVRQQVVAVDVHLEGLVAGLVALLELVDDVGVAGGGEERRQPVVVLDDLVRHDARSDPARPADQLGNPEAPSQLVFFSLRNGVVAPSGQVFSCGPLSVLYTTIVSSVMPSSSRRSSSWPTLPSWSIIVSWYGDCQRPAWPMLSGFVCVRRCMWVDVHPDEERGLRLRPGAG